MSKTNLDILESAIVFAVNKHHGMVRKGDGRPYITHPMEVLSIASGLTHDKEILAAAVLHDTLEDTDTTQQELIDNFGDRVTYIVLGETEDKMRNVPATESWKKRKEAAIKYLETSSTAEKIVCLADKLSNMRGLVNSCIEEGDSLWQKFNNKDPKEHIWYHKSISNILKPQFHCTPEWQEYDRLICELDIISRLK